MLPGHLATVRCLPGLCPCSWCGTVGTSLEQPRVCAPWLCQMPAANKCTWAPGDRCPCLG